MNTSIRNITDPAILAKVSLNPEDIEILRTNPDRTTCELYRNAIVNKWKKYETAARGVWNLKRGTRKQALTLRQRCVVAIAAEHERRFDKERCYCDDLYREEVDAHNRRQNERDRANRIKNREDERYLADVCGIRVGDTVTMNPSLGEVGEYLVMTKQARNPSWTGVVKKRESDGLLYVLARKEGRGRAKQLSMMHNAWRPADRSTA